MCPNLFCIMQHVMQVTDLTGLNEVMVVVMHCLPDLVCTVSIYCCQISTQLIYPLLCHALSYMHHGCQHTYSSLYSTSHRHMRSLHMMHPPLTALHHRH